MHYSHKTTYIFVLIAALFLAGCVTDPYTGERKISKTAMGAGLGALLSGLLTDPNITTFGMSWGNTLNLATRFIRRTAHEKLATGNRHHLVGFVLQARNGAAIILHLLFLGHLPGGENVLTNPLHQGQVVGEQIPLLCKAIAADFGVILLRTFLSERRH